MTEEERGVFDRALSLLRALVSDLDRRFLEFQETEALAAELRPALIRLGRDLRRAVQVAIKESRDYSAFSEVNETGQLLLKEVNTLDSFLRMPLVLSKVSKEGMWLTSRVAGVGGVSSGGAGARSGCVVGDVGRRAVGDRGGMVGGKRGRDGAVVGPACAMV